MLKVYLSWRNIVKRRDVLAGLGAVGALAAAPRSLLADDGRAGMNVLFLGGTGFIGPHIVRALRNAGHKLTLFNRGKTNPDLFPGLELIQGDRLTDSVSQLRGRQWDAVIDTSAYFPRALDNVLAQLDTEAIKQYVFISTISVYANFGAPNIDEGAPTAELPDPESEDTQQYYGALKAACEQVVEKALPGRVTTIRPGLIVGPGDRTDRFTYWPVRVARGGEVLAPGNPGDPIQTMDARDLANWVAHCVDQRVTGVFNATSGAGETFGDVIYGCQKLLNPKAELSWLPHEFLLEQGVQEWSDLPFWVNPDGELGGAWSVNVARATAAGLRHRPIGETIVDTDAWFQTLPEERRATLRAGMSAEREAEVLAAWHKRSKK
jgi:2'-hydroxyisoflavone reductase